MEERIARARQLLQEIHHVPLATVNKDGTPHNSPLFVAFDEALMAYWASHPESLHSRNIARDPRVFMVIFDSREGHGGLYIEAVAEALEDPREVAVGYRVLADLKERFYGSMDVLEGYQGSGTQRIYRAKPLKAWVNKSDKNASGAIVKDARYEIPISELRRTSLPIIGEPSTIPLRKHEHKQ